MSRQVYLHVGAPKTGTTYLQDRLARNARELSRHGVHFPARHPLAHPATSQFRAALDLLGQDWGGPAGHAEGAWPAMVKRVRRLDGTVVLSHEILGAAQPDAVARALGDLSADGSEVHVVYSARDLGRQVPAAWQESVKQGRSWTYQRFQRRMVAGTTWFARSFDLPSVLGTWGADLPADRLHVITVPHGGTDRLWPRLCEVVGADPTWGPRDSTRDNRSLGIAETQVLRELNSRIGRRTRREASYDAAVRVLLDEGALANRKGTRLAVPPALHPWCVAEADRWAAWIAEHGVHVVGDVAELQPAPPLAAADYRGPSRASQRVMLRSALDALAAMTAEAARRPDPGARPIARVREAVARRGQD